jgi:Flp pilus assembly protein TadD
VKAALLLAALAACGGSGSGPAPRAPAPAVRAEVGAAETSERARQHEQARAHYERAIADARDPLSVAFARHEYAETLASWGELPAAVAQLEGAVAARPDDASAWHDLGVLRHEVGDARGATDALRRAKQLAPDDARPRIALAALYWTQHDLAAATAEYRELDAMVLPDRLHEKVRWALDELAKLQAAGHTPDHR